MLCKPEFDKLVRHKACCILLQHNRFALQAAACKCYKPLEVVVITSSRLPSHPCRSSQKDSLSTATSDSSSSRETCLSAHRNGGIPSKSATFCNLCGGRVPNRACSCTLLSRGYSSSRRGSCSDLHGIRSLRWHILGARFWLPFSCMLRAHLYCR